MDVASIPDKLQQLHENTDTSLSWTLEETKANK